MRRNRIQSGFTLIELLVVIAIIAILAAILFPVFARAREKARANTCLSNMKQLTLGVLMYVNDWDEWMPLSLAGWRYTPSWKSGIYPYVKNVQIFRCPSRPNAGNSAEVVPGTSSFFPVGYGINCDCGYEGSPVTGMPQNWGWGWIGPQNLASIKKPAETLVLAETWDPEFPYIGQGASNACYNVAAVHSGLWHLGFCDGHAKAMKPTATILGQNMWSIQDDTPTTNNHGLLIPTMQAAELCANNQ